jgi:hypothetical protein
MSRLQRIVERGFDGGVLAFAGFTVCAHASVALGWGLDRLGWLAVGGAIATVALVPMLRRFGTEPTGTGGLPEAVATDEAPATWQRIAVAATAAAASGVLLLDGPLAGVWCLAALAVGFACVLELARGTPAQGEPYPGDARTTTWLVALAVVCLGVTLVSHRPDADDAFYLNLAVAAREAPGAPLLAGDTLHRVAGAPLALPVYRVHSYELLQATLARWTGRPVLDVAHLWLPALAALLLPFVHARVLRRLVPRAWPAATGVVVAVLLFAAAASHGWANFGLVRLHQGKGVLLSLLLPAVVGYGLRFARRGDLRSWLLLAAAQIAALGVSASALWLAPAVAGTALLAGLPSPGSNHGTRRLGLGLAASAYPLAAGLLLRAETMNTFAQAAVPSPEMSKASGELAAEALAAVLGPGFIGAATLFVVIAAWSFARTPVARRLCAFAAAAALLLWNPFLADRIAAHLTSAATYWRVLWVLPLPTLLAVVLVLPMERPGDRAPGLRAWAAVAFASLLVFGGLALADPRSAVLSAKNSVRLDWPGWKVPPKEFAVARIVVEASGPDQVVLAPQAVAPWIPTLAGYPAVLVVRIPYLPVLAPVLQERELQQRVRLMRLVSGRNLPPAAIDTLRDTIARDDLRVVALATRALRWPELTALLGETGFQKIHQDADYQVWKRTPPSGDTSQGASS